MFDEERSTPQRKRFIELALADTDRRVAEGRAVAPSFMLACLLWHDVQGRWQELRKRGEHPLPALQQAIDAVFDARIGDVSGRGRLAADMREIWMMQPRFERRQANSAQALVAQPRFRAGYDFLRLRADAQEVEVELADWWEDFSLGDADEREALLQLAREAERTRRHAEPASLGQRARGRQEAPPSPAFRSQTRRAATPHRRPQPAHERRRRCLPSSASVPTSNIPRVQVERGIEALQAIAAD